MHHAWARNDSAALWDLLLQGPFTSDPILHATMFASRNRLRVPQIMAAGASARENILVVVGAGHLDGPGNLVEFFRAHGLELRPLQNAWPSPRSSSSRYGES